MPPSGGDLVLKQLVARIDNRTTVICLHAAGQIQRVTDPYQTLNGYYQTPPFHLHCRSISIPWMPGFVSTMRTDANRELLTRPLKTRRIGPNGEIGGHLPPAPPKDVSDAAAAVRSTRARMQATLDHADEVVSRSSMDPGMDLARVPDRDVESFIRAHPERFEVTSNGGGISETYWVTDTKTGLRYVLKRGQYNAESLNEVMSTRVASRLGLHGDARIAGEIGDGNGWVLIKHAEDLPENVGWKVKGTAPGHSKQVELLSRLEDPSQAVRKMLVDFVTDEADAKGGNLLLLERGGKIRLSPIDRSLSLRGWAGAIEPGKSSLVAGDWSLRARMAVKDLREYMKTRGSPRGMHELVLRLAETSDGQALVQATYDEVLATLKSIDLDEMFAGLDHAAVADAKALIRRRIEVLEEQRAKILRQMGVVERTEAESLPRSAFGDATYLKIDGKTNGTVLDWNTALTDDEKHAVSLYTSPKTFQAVQDAVRAGRPYIDSKTGQDVIAVMDALMERGLLPENVTLHRAMKVTEQFAATMRPGAVLEHDGFVSTTNYGAYAFAFGASGNAEVQVTLRVLVPKGTHAIPGESRVGEYILARGTKMKVREVIPRLESDGTPRRDDKGLRMVEIIAEVVS